MHFKTHCSIVVLLIGLGVLAPTAQKASGVTSSYHVGNSLTYDSQPLGIQALAESRGLDHEVGFHIRVGSSLTEIVSYPDETNIAPNEYGTYSQALPNNHWDIVTLQPHNSERSTLGMDLEAILSLIDLTRSNPSNAETNFYIYQTWPTLTNNFQNAWTQPSANDLSTFTSKTREYFNNVLTRVRAATDANVYMIPVGDVMYELDVRMRAGKIPGYNSVNQLYRDALHLNNDTGRFVASVTAFATTLGQYPNELEKPDGFYGNPNSPNAVQRALILETIRDVLDKHLFSGVKMPAPLRADFDGNLVVDELDLQFLQTSLGIQDPYDIDLDGEVNGRDFLAWQRNFHPQLTPAEAADFARADLNGDGHITNTDIQVWKNAYGINDGADLDGDGDTDGRDFLVWQRSAPLLFGDVDRDLLVNGVELGAWQDSYGFSLVADANGDGLVNTIDYEIWQEENGLSWNFPYAFSAPPLASQNPGLQGVAVPEPGCAMLSFLCFFLSTIRPRQSPLSIVRARN